LKAPWYHTNEQLHNDIKFPTIEEHIRKLTENTEEKMKTPQPTDKKNNGIEEEMKKEKKTRKQRKTTKERKKSKHKAKRNLMMAEKRRIFKNRLTEHCSVQSSPLNQVVIFVELVGDWSFVYQTSHSELFWRLQEKNVAQKDFRNRKLFHFYVNFINLISVYRCPRTRAPEKTDKCRPQSRFQKCKRRIINGLHKRIVRHLRSTNSRKGTLRC
jgi:hypothetical protein